jgi:hypothetical protein
MNCTNCSSVSSSSSSSVTSSDLELQLVSAIGLMVETAVLILIGLTAGWSNFFFVFKKK